MPLPIVNSIASWFLKKRIHQIDLFLKYPIDVQDELLKGLIHKAKSTEIGKQYDFKSINNYYKMNNKTFNESLVWITLINSGYLKHNCSIRLSNPSLERQKKEPKVFLISS